MYFSCQYYFSAIFTLSGEILDRVIIQKGIVRIAMKTYSGIVSIDLTTNCHGFCSLNDGIAPLLNLPVEAIFYTTFQFRRKDFKQATLVALIFHIRSNTGELTDNLDSVNQLSRKPEMHYTRF